MRNRRYGFTLLELLVALALTGILFAVGLPTWGTWMSEQALADRADALLHSLDHARSEALKRGMRVNVCPNASGACPGPAATWDSGWSVRPGADNAAPISRERGASPGITIRGNRPVADYVSYTSLGYARRIDGGLQMGTFTICKPGHKARKVIVANSGRARVETTTEACP
jgi:type IV fimbrial biogenesis protein FimT